MKKYIIKVNGTPYEVEVEEIGEVITASPTAFVAPTVNAPITTASAPVAPATATKASTVEGATNIKAPMPGNILDVKITNGASIKKGDVLVILEAMKMENDIVSPVDGTIVAVNVTKGQTVNTGDLLVSIS